MTDLREYIPTGKENAIHRQELAEIMGVSTRSLRSLISSARKNGEEILSGSSGYWYAADDMERELYIRMQYRRAMSSLRSIKHIREILKIDHKQLSFFDSEVTDGE